MQRRSLVAVVIVLVGACAGLGFFWPFGQRAQVLRLPGIVEIQEVRLGSKVGGRVAKVVVQEGDIVTAGQPLVYFEVPELQTQRDQVQARLQAAVAEWDRAKAGPRIEEKAAAKAAVEAAHARWQRLQVGWREEEKRQAASELDSAEADLKQANEDFARIAELLRQKIMSRADYDAAWANRERTRGRADAARARNDMMKTGSRVEDIDEARAEWKKALAKYEELQAGTRTEDIMAAEARTAEIRSRLRELEVNLREEVVRAPEKAVVEVLAVRKGDLVPPNQPVIRILRAEDLWVKVYVPETELAKVALQTVVDIKIDAYPDKTLQGTVVQVASISEFTPRNVQSVDERRNQVFAIKVRVDNPQGIFKAGMAAEVVLPLREDDKVTR